MSNSYFIVQNGLQVGPLTIDANTGSISTSGDVSITGNLGVSQISKNDSKVSINDTGTSSTIVMTIDNTDEVSIDVDGLKLATGDALYIGGTSVLDATTLGSGVVNSSLTSVGTLTNLTVTNTITGNVSGNAGTATKLATARTVSLSGDVTGSGTFDGTGDLAINATIAANSIELGTDTTGNYVATVAGTTNQISVAGSGSESAALTLSLPQDIHTGAAPTFAGATLTGILTGTTINAATIGNTGAAITGATVNAATIGNTGATLTGTLSTATQNSVTTMAGLTSFGTAAVVTSAAGDLAVAGNLTVNGTTTTINASTLVVNDKNVTLANVATPTDVTADGGGITVLGATNKTFNWVSAASAWTSSEDINVVTGKGYEVNGVSVLDATTLGSGVVNSSLTSVGTIGTGTWQGSVIGATYGGTGVNNGANTITATSSVNLNQNLRTTDAPTFAGLTSSAAIVPSANASINLGSTTAWYNNVYGVTFVGVSTTAKYADLAENYAADAEYEPGTVVCFGGDAEVTICDIDHCQKVAGVVSTDPAYLMNSGLEGTKAAVALQGRVPCKVVGSVRKGDMMVAAGNGRARAEANPKIGAVIGKALENFDGTEGVIEVVIGRV